MTTTSRSLKLANSVGRLPSLKHVYDIIDFPEPLSDIRGHRRPSGDPLVSLDLGAMHDAPRVGAEGVAPVQHREVVPHQEIADLPFMAHGELGLRGMGSERIEQSFAVR